MKILVMDKTTAKVFTLECESTDTIAHLKAKLDKIAGKLMFDGKQLGKDFLEFDMRSDTCSENMTLADVGIQDGSLILDSSSQYLSTSRSKKPKRRPENDYLYYADAFKSGWREEHAKALLHLLLELCQDGTISEGNVTDEAWLRIQNSLKNSMKCSFQIDFLKERLHDYKNLYSVLALAETSSTNLRWDRERKIITIDIFCNWREEYPELLLLCGPHIPYFDTLEEVCLLVNTTRSSKQHYKRLALFARVKSDFSRWSAIINVHFLFTTVLFMTEYLHKCAFSLAKSAYFVVVQRVSEISTNINNAQQASSSRGQIFIRRPSNSNLSLMGSSTLIGKENGYLPSTMKILVVEWNAKVFSIECELTDTIAHLTAKLGKITKDLMFDGKWLGDEFSENMTLADVGVQDGSFIFRDTREPTVVAMSCAGIERPQSPRRAPEKDYLYYADAFKSGWREEHAKALLHLLLELCQDGTISEDNVTDEAWLRIQNSLKNSMNCSFQIDFLKERLDDYKQLYSVLTETTSSSIFNWDHERKIITIMQDDYLVDIDWRKKYPELLLLCGPYIPYFDTLEKVCLLLNTGQSSEQRGSETSTNRTRVHQDIPRRRSKLRSLLGKSQRS